MTTSNRIRRGARSIQIWAAVSTLVGTACIGVTNGDGPGLTRAGTTDDLGDLANSQCPPTPPDCFDESCVPACDEYWVCEDLGADGGKRCVSPGGGDGYPDGGGDTAWDCYSVAEFRVCDTTSEPDGSFPGRGPDPEYRNPSDPFPGDFDGTGETVCFYPTDDALDDVIVQARYAFQTVEGKDMVYIGLAFNEAFVDNTYGANSSDGYSGKKDFHTFKDLVGSDHVVVSLLDGNDELAMELKLDYISESGDMASGYRSLGVSGGDGDMKVGDEAHVLDAMSSLDRNFNELGCVETEDSPLESECPGWNNTVVYEVWVSADAFGAAGFGRPNLESVHASPSRLTNTVPVEPGPCI